MRFREIASRLTGISSPVFGVSWQPPEPERAIARRVIAFLEDRRVLYNPSDMEVPHHCVMSVQEIRGFLTHELQRLDSEGEMAKSLRSLRAACRKFMDTVGSRDDLVRFGAHQGHYASWEFNSAIGELRGVFGLHLAILATSYGLDVEDPLSEILPWDDQD